MFCSLPWRDFEAHTSPATGKVVGKRPAFVPARLRVRQGREWSKRNRLPPAQMSKMGKSCFDVTPI
jgi:hypothetical protein